MLLLLCAATLADYPPAAGSGNASCNYNADCGVPAANCDTLRQDCVSLTGHCQNPAPGVRGALSLLRTKTTRPGIVPGARQLRVRRQYVWLQQLCGAVDSGAESER